MKQILHIFSKDVRRLWIEILLSVVVAALFTWVTPKSWMSGTIGESGQSQTIAYILRILVLVSWCLLIARLIHGEALVGDRQFWITRPYEWPKLLAAKALFIALFLYLPYLLIEIVILLEARFNPLTYIPGLLYELLLISLVFFPLIGLAAVTSNLVRMVLTILGIFVAFVVLALTSSVRYDGRDGPVKFDPVSSGGIATIAIVLLVCGAVVVLQYARRRVLIARLLLGSTPFLVLLLSTICNSGSSMDRVYAPAAQNDPSVLRMIPFAQDDARRTAAGGWSMAGHGNYSNIDKKKWAAVKVELRASGVTAGDRWQLDALRPTLTPANGAPLKLDWQRKEGVFDQPDGSSALDYTTLDFLMRRSDYERLKSSPLTLHLDLAFTQARPAWSQQFPLPEGNFMIPGFASCSTMEVPMGLTLEVFEVVCRFPLRAPMLTIVTAPLTKGPCHAVPAAANDAAHSALSSVGDFGADPASFGISPVEERDFLNGNYFNTSNGRPPDDTQFTRLCPGTPVLVTQYRKVRTVQSGVTLENFRLGDQ